MLLFKPAPMLTRYFGTFFPENPGFDPIWQKPPVALELFSLKNRDSAQFDVSILWLWNFLHLKTVIQPNPVAVTPHFGTFFLKKFTVIPKQQLKHRRFKLNISFSRKFSGNDLHINKQI